MSAGLMNGNYFSDVQCRFAAYLSSTQANVTGAGTGYVIPFDTEFFDIGSNFNTSTGTLTCPVDGYYYLHSVFLVTSVTSAMTALRPSFYINSGSFSLNTNYINIAAIRNSNNQAGIGISTLYQFSAGDTVNVRIVVANGAGDTAGVFGGTSGDATQTRFEGTLLYKE
ncbi:MAG: hypothetical protein R6V36_08615 [Psychroflexus sp.]